MRHLNVLRKQNGGSTHRRRLGDHAAADLVPELAHPRRPTPPVLALSRHPAGRCRTPLGDWAGSRRASRVERLVWWRGLGPQ